MLQPREETFSFIIAALEVKKKRYHNVQNISAMDAVLVLGIWGSVDQ